MVPGYVGIAGVVILGIGCGDGPWLMAVVVAEHDDAGGLCYDH